MSLAESFLNTAKDMLLMSENIKRIDSQVDRIHDDIAGIDRRVMRIEVMIEFAKLTPQTSSKKHPPKKLP